MSIGLWTFKVTNSPWMFKILKFIGILDSLEMANGTPVKFIFFFFLKKNKIRQRQIRHEIKSLRA